ncbi:MAG TPA: cytochrome c-type biogenesis protein CcmH [Baekduia sp.]|nr:cytochrome c-type biogenesis protein CcmH [Baekduia sp.]
MRRLTLLGLLLVAVLALPAGAHAAPARFLDVEDEVMCVSCNVPLNIAESPQADRTRAIIREYIAQGLSKDEIKDRLVAQYGENVLADPETDGFGITTLLVPLGAAALLIALLLLLLPRWRRRAAADPDADASAPPLPERDLALLEADMARYER